MIGRWLGFLLLTLAALAISVGLFVTEAATAYADTVTPSPDPSNVQLAEALPVITGCAVLTVFFAAVLTTYTVVRRRG